MTKEQLENSFEEVSDLKRKLAKANADSKLWKTKYEADAFLRIEDINQQNSKFKSKLVEEENLREDLKSKYEMLKKAKYGLFSELNDMKVVLEKTIMVERKISESEHFKEKKRMNLLNLNEQCLQVTNENKSYWIKLVKIRADDDDLNQKELWL